MQRGPLAQILGSWQRYMWTSLL